MSAEPGGFTAAEGQVIADGAHDALLAGLAHRFAEPSHLATHAGGGEFLGRALTATVLRAQLDALMDQIDRIVRRMTSSRHYEQFGSVDPLQGQLDLGRLGAMVSVPGDASAVWPLVRTRTSRNTPENALLLAFLATVGAWARGATKLLGAWRGIGLFEAVINQTLDLDARLREHFGYLPLEERGPVALLPLTLERLAFGNAPADAYAPGIAIVSASLPLVLPGVGNPQLAKASLDQGLAAFIGQLGDAGFANDVFELWVLSQVVKAAEAAGGSVEYSAGRSERPFATISGDDWVIEVWWQSPRPILDWPSATRWFQRNEAIVDWQASVSTSEVESNAWRALTLLPDIVVVRREGETSSLIAIECKNKKRARADARDVAQAIGYLTHYEALTMGALMYRVLPNDRLLSSMDATQTLVVGAAPVEPGAATGARLLTLL